MARQRAAIVAAMVGVAALALAAPGESSTSRQLRVALVESAGATSVGGIERPTHLQFVRSVHELGLAGRIFEVPPGQDPVALLTRLARRHYDLTIVLYATPDQPQLAAAAAAAVPGTRLLFPGLSTATLSPRPPNVAGYVFRTEEASYLAGYLAGGFGKERSGAHVVSAVGGVPGPIVDRFIKAYRAGAQKADPRVEVLKDYSYDFAGAPKCRRIALDQIEKGSRVVFDVAGACGEGALQAAIGRSVWGIGVDTDHASLGPHILTSVIRRDGVALQIELRAFKTGQLPASGTTSLGLREGAVALGRISPAVPLRLVREVARLRAAIARGTLHVVA
jgi:basic membrane protein A